MSTPDFDNKLYSPKYDYDITTDIISGYDYGSNSVLESSINHDSISGFEFKLSYVSEPELDTTTSLLDTYNIVALEDSTTSSGTDSSGSNTGCSGDNPIFPTITWSNGYVSYIKPNLSAWDANIVTWKAMGPTAYVTTELLFGRCYTSNKLTTMYPFRLKGCDSSYLKIYNEENGSTEYRESTCSNVFLLETVGEYDYGRASFSIYPSECYTHRVSDFYSCDSSDSGPSGDSNDSSDPPNYGLINNFYYSVCIESCCGSITLYAPGDGYYDSNNDEEDWQGAIYIKGRNTYIGTEHSKIITLGCQNAELEYINGCFCIKESSFLTSKYANIQSEEVSLGTHNIYYHFHDPNTKDEDGNWIYYHGYALSTSSKTNIYGETIRLESHPSISYHQCTTTDYERCDEDMLCDAFTPKSYIELTDSCVLLSFDKHTNCNGCVDLRLRQLSSYPDYAELYAQAGPSTISLNPYGLCSMMPYYSLLTYCEASIRSSNDKGCASITTKPGCINIYSSSQVLIGTDSNANMTCVIAITPFNLFIEPYNMNIATDSYGLGTYTNRGYTTYMETEVKQTNSGTEEPSMYINTSVFDESTMQGTYEVTRGIYSSSIDSHTSVVKNLHDRIFRLSCDSTSFCAKPTVALKDDVLYEYEVWQTISGTDVTYEAPAGVVWLCGNPADKVTTLYTGTTLYYSFRAFNKKDSEGATVVEIHGNMYAQVDPT